MVAFFILSLGALFVAISSYPHVRFILTSFLHSPKVDNLFYIGVTTLGLGVLLVIGLYFLGRKKTFQVQMQCLKTDIDKEIIREYVSVYWKGIFTGSHRKVDVALHPGGRLEIISEIPKFSQEEEREEMLFKIQNELGAVLARRLGYEKEFILTLSEV